MTPPLLHCRPSRVGGPSPPRRTRRARRSRTKAAESRGNQHARPGAAAGSTLAPASWRAGCGVTRGRLRRVGLARSAAVAWLWEAVLVEPEAVDLAVLVAVHELGQHAELFLQVALLGHEVTAWGRAVKSMVVVVCSVKSLAHTKSSACVAPSTPAYLVDAAASGFLI